MLTRYTAYYANRDGLSPLRYWVTSLVVPAGGDAEQNAIRTFEREFSRGAFLIRLVYVGTAAGMALGGPTSTAATYAYNGQTKGVFITEGRA